MRGIAFLRNPSSLLGGLIVGLYVIASLLAAFGLTPYDSLGQDPLSRLKAPSMAHWAGTDLFGRDVLSRLVVGIQKSFIIGFLAVAFAATLGTTIGLTAAWWGNRFDGVLMRFMDVLLAFPAILLALLIVSVMGPGLPTSVFAIGIVFTPIFARVARGPALSIRTRDFVDAARTFGSSNTYVLTHHLLLNLVGPVTVQITLALSWAILTEASLSFLGLGTQPPSPSLGLMLSESRNLMELAPWLMIFPGLVIMLGVLGFNLLGDGLRDVLDPRTGPSR